MRPLHQGQQSKQEQAPQQCLGLHHAYYSLSPSCRPGCSAQSWPQGERVPVHNASEASRGVPPTERSLGAGARGGHLDGAGTYRCCQLKLRQCRRPVMRRQVTRCSVERRGIQWTEKDVHWTAKGDHWRQNVFPGGEPCLSEWMGVT